LERVLPGRLVSPAAARAVASRFPPTPRRWLCTSRRPTPPPGSLLTVYPAGTAWPTPSNLKWAPGETVANLVTVQVGSAGEGSFVPLTPDRTCDTRPASVTGSTNQGSGRTLGAGSNLAVQVLGDGGVPATNVTAGEVNVTATDSPSPGFLTVYPGGTVPTAANVNWGPGETASKFTIATLSSAGSSTVDHQMGSPDVVFDVVGYFSPRLPQRPPVPAAAGGGGHAGRAPHCRPATRRATTLRPIPRPVADLARPTVAG
jgi:hypothetical protein